MILTTRYNVLMLVLKNKTKKKINLQMKKCVILCKKRNIIGTEAQNNYLIQRAHQNN